MTVLTNISPCNFTVILETIQKMEFSALEILPSARRQVYKARVVVLITVQLVNMWVPVLIVCYSCSYFRKGD